MQRSAVALSTIWYKTLMVTCLCIFTLSCALMPTLLVFLYVKELLYTPTCIALSCVSTTFIDTWVRRQIHTYAILHGVVKIIIVDVCLTFSFVNQCWQLLACKILSAKCNSLVLYFSMERKWDSTICFPRWIWCLCKKCQDPLRLTVAHWFLRNNLYFRN